jgi:hypothetical protein
MIAITTEGVAPAQSELEELEAENAKLKARVRELEAKLADAVIGEMEAQAPVVQEPEAAAIAPEPVPLPDVVALAVPSPPLA